MSSFEQSDNGNVAVQRSVRDPLCVSRPATIMPLSHLPVQAFEHWVHEHTTKGLILHNVLRIFTVHILENRLIQRMAQPDFLYANTIDLDSIETVSNGQHSRHSSYSSGLSRGSNKENGSHQKQASIAGSDLSSDTTSDSQIILRDGGDLLGESRTELSTALITNDHSTILSETTDTLLPLPQISSRPSTKVINTAPTGSAKAKAAKSPFTA
ncbi:hypothetical protein Btru_026635, partial [Bulinus truncatus]